MQNLTLQSIQNDKLLFAMLILLCIALIISFLMMLVVFIYYINFSWIKRSNSRNINGEQLTREILDENGSRDVEIRSSWFYFKYFNIRKRTGVYKLAPWTCRRESLWTMTEAAQQAVVSTWRHKKGKMKVAFTIFKIPTILSIVSTLIWLGIILYLFLSINTSQGVDASTDHGKKVMGIVAMGFVIAAFISGWADVAKMAIIKKHVLPILIEKGFTQEEQKAFKIIYTSRLLLAIAIAILNSIRLVLEIVARRKDGNK